MRGTKKKNPTRTINIMATSGKFTMRGTHYPSHTEGVGELIDVFIDHKYIKNVSNLSHEILQQVGSNSYRQDTRFVSREKRIASVYANGNEFHLRSSLPLQFVRLDTVERSSLTFKCHSKVKIRLKHDDLKSGDNLADILNESVIKGGIMPIAKSTPPLRHNFIESVECYASVLLAANTEVFLRFLNELRDRYGIIGSISIISDTSSQVKGEDVTKFLETVNTGTRQLFRHLTFSISIGYLNQYAGMHVYSEIDRVIREKNLEHVKVNCILGPKALTKDKIYNQRPSILPRVVNPFMSAGNLEENLNLSVHACLSILKEYYNRTVLHSYYYATREASFFLLPPNIFDLIHACLVAVEKNSVSDKKEKAIYHREWIEPLTTPKMGSGKIFVAYINDCYALPLYFTIVGLLPSCLDQRNYGDLMSVSCPVILKLYPGHDVYRLAEQGNGNSVMMRRSCMHAAMSRLNIRHLLLYAALMLPFLDSESPVMGDMREKTRDENVYSLWLMIGTLFKPILDSFPFCTRGPYKLVFAMTQFSIFCFSSYCLQGDFLRCWGNDFLTQNPVALISFRLIYTLICHAVFYCYSTSELRGLDIHKHLMQDAVKFIIENNLSLLSGGEDFMDAMKGAHASPGRADSMENVAAGAGAGGGSGSHSSIFVCGGETQGEASGFMDEHDNSVEKPLIPVLQGAA